MAEVTPTIGWEVQSHGVSSNGLVADNYRALHRSDSGELINIVKKSYQVLSNETFEQTVKDLADVTGLKIEGFSASRDNGVILGYLKNDSDRKIGDFDTSNYMLLGNSHDYSKGFFIGITNKVFRCQNEFSHIKTLQTVRHNKQMTSRIDQLKMYYADYAKQEAELMTTFEQWLTRRITKEDKDHFVHTVLEIDTAPGVEISPRKINIKNDLMMSVNREIDAMGANLWSLFNGVTHYTTHVKQSKNRMFGNPIGSLGELNQTSFKTAAIMAPDLQVA